MGKDCLSCKGMGTVKRKKVVTVKIPAHVPLDSRGQAHCVLKFADGEIRVTAQAVRLEMRDVPKYIEHVRPTAAS